MGVIRFRRGGALIDAGGGSPAPPPSFPSVASVVARYEADDPSLVTTTINQNFAATDVNTTSDTIALPDLGFGNVTSPGNATPVYFSTTDTLPAPLVAGQPYYIKPTGGTYAGTYDVYPTAVQSDWSTIPGMIAVDRTLVAQNFVQGVNKINFTTQGAGTHTISSNPLVNVVRNIMSDTRLDMTVGGASDKHGWFEIKTDGQGHKGFYNCRSAQEVGNPNYNDGGGARGKVCSQTGDRVYARSLFGAKRSVYITAVIKTDPVPFLKQYPKVYVTPGMVSGSVITLTKNHLFATADKVKVSASAGNLPTSLTAGTEYFVRNRAARSLSLHPTAADASADTNAITLGMVTGDAFCIFATAKAVNERWGFIGGVYGPDTGQSFNALAPRINHYGPTSLGLLTMSATTVGITGTNSGAFFLTGTGNNFPDLSQIRIWFPEGSVPPQRTDTGLAMTEGLYYVTRQPGNNARIRLHDNLASAQASVGIATNLSSCIKFNNVTPSGQVLMALAEGTDIISSNHRFNTAMQLYQTATFAENTKKVITLGIDYNDPAESFVIFKVYINGVMVEKFVTADTKQNLPANDASNGAAWTFLSDLDSHVSFDGACYSFVIGVDSAGLSDTDIASIHSFYMSKYSIT